MSRIYRRFEVLLPLRFNDGQSVPDELIGDVILELRRQFGAVSCETQTIRGLWQEDERLFRDDLVRLFVDVPDTLESREFFVQFKQRIIVQFKQIDIWMTTYPIEVL